MIRRAATFVFAAFIASNLAACNLATKGQGPTVWIDQPLEGDRVPLAPVIPQAHASDADGVAAIEFYASEALLGAVAVGGGRLGGAPIERNPPARGE